MKRALAVVLLVALGGTALAQGESLTIGDVSFELRPVPAGPKPVQMMRAPVTRGQFDAFVAETGYVTEAERTHRGLVWDGTQLVPSTEADFRHPGFEQTSSHPVVLVTVADANAFASWFSAKTAKKARLPTDVELDRAADDRLTTPRADGGTSPVGGEPNALGLVDLAGDVWQWCEDGDGGERILRGSAWHDPPTARPGTSHARADEARADVGFRLVVVESAPIVAPSASTPPPPAKVPAAREEHDEGFPWAMAAVLGLVVGGIWVATRRGR